MLIDLDDPPVEPITLAETKTFLRVDHDDDDGLIATLIASARQTLENHLNVAMIRRSMQLSSPATDEFRLPRWPVTSVETVLVDGEQATDYIVNLRKRPATVCASAMDHVEIAFTAGYGTEPSDIPAPLRQALLLLVAQAYEHRDATPSTLPLMVDALTMPYRVVGL
ncbi:head-tail connector protein [Algimonas porphyrae]|uniref:Phage gp6-like head-tail connector protein n=1 Tax=Algimonas porphyrae TaxID=1128113 RepID=A0ABQ5UYZ5_9PROT|nr:head-tail connector protein [Algimonas porphyrae]GLQ19664.1 hypothetical protein GCM10007854_06190 [Algimonas porphyrae]